MKVIKKINNNVAVCIDSNGNELIAFGNGIGFPKTPYELNDMSKIVRTFYGVDLSYLGLLNEIPKDIFEISAKIVDYAKSKISYDLNPNVVFTLADHLHFMIQRYEKRIQVKMPFLYDIEHLYEKEMDIGLKSIAYINKVKHINLPKSESAGIALHFINAENSSTNSDEKIDEKRMMIHITQLIENDLQIKINKRSINYSRFATHMQYLLKRQKNQTSILSENKRLYEKIKDEFPKTYLCALDIRSYIEKSMKWTLSDEELLYLMLHINRLCSREDCMQ